MDTKKTSHGQNLACGPQVDNPWIIYGVTAALSPSDQMYNGKTVNYPPSPIGPTYLSIYLAIFRLFLVGHAEGGGRCRSQVEPEPQTHLGPYLKQTSSPPLQSRCLSWALPCAHSLGEGRASNSGPSWLWAKKFGYLLQTQLGGCGAKGIIQISKSRLRGGEA